MRKRASVATNQWDKGLADALLTPEHSSGEPARSDVDEIGAERRLPGSDQDEM